MNEDLFGSANYTLCQNLLALKKDDEWQRDHGDFYAYTKKRWGLSKTRTKLLLAFVHFVTMAREARMRLPESPENVAPVLNLPQKLWLVAWEYCVTCAEGPITLSHVQATLARFGLISRKKLPPEVMDNMRAKRAAKNLAEIENVENVKSVSNDWEAGVHNMIEIDQQRMNRR